MMTDQEKVTLAFDILEDAEVMQEFDDEVWIKIDKELWYQFQGTDDEVHSGQDSQDRKDR
jgi:hypothetical protein